MGQKNTTPTFLPGKKPNILFPLVRHSPNGRRWNDRRATMKRCKSCLTKSEAENGLCPICGIQQDKKKRALSPDEKKVRYHARAIRGVAMLHLIGIGAGVISQYYFPIAAVAMLILIAINLTLAIGLSRYAFWAYRLATVYYFLIGMVNIISVNLPGILMILLLLYFIGNGTAKAIFERRAFLPHIS
jgi:hypothetical protein